ncbi:hypothetical protein IRJ41_018884, partial [Triplophysa rosa]
QTGNLCGDAFYKSFLEWSICRYEVDKICGTQHFMCPACTPLILAVAVDGNRKLHRFKTGGKLFTKLMALKSEAPGKGVCGSAEFAAAQESSRKSSSGLDEEGIELAVCRQKVLLRALNMFRERYMHIHCICIRSFALKMSNFCADITCKYWPYLIKVSNGVVAIKLVLPIPWERKWSRPMAFCQGLL